jgi:hypothetical protein
LPMARSSMLPWAPAWTACTWLLAKTAAESKAEAGHYHVWSWPGVHLTHCDGCVQQDSFTTASTGYNASCHTACNPYSQLTAALSVQANAPPQHTCKAAACSGCPGAPE